MIEGAGCEHTPPPAALAAFSRIERAGDGVRRWLRRMRKRMSGQPLNLLVELNWRLGDEIMALPVYEALLRARPGTRIVVRVRYPELLIGNPFVAGVNPTTHHCDERLLLRGERMNETRRETLSGLAGTSLDGLLPRVYLSQQEMESTGVPELAGRRRGDGASRPRVVLHPGSTQTCKNWGRERWREVAVQLMRAGADVVEVGTGRVPLGVGLSLIDRTGVRELARVLAAAQLVAGDDSGPLHLALAVGTRTVGVFGATDSTLLYPDSERFTAVTSSATCRFCWPQRVLAWPSGECPQVRHECMDAVEVAAVVRACLKALDGKVTAHA